MSVLQQFINTYLERRKEKKYVAQLQNLYPKTNLRSHLYPDKVCFSHIGLIGDIIYSMPCMLALAGDKKIELYLDTTQKSMYPKKYKHYNDNKILTEKSVSFLRPLILSNPAFALCNVLGKESIDYDLNEFRRYPFDYRMGHICRWYFLTYAVSYNLGAPWLNVQPDNQYKNDILIARSFRYRAPGINYSFLRKLENVSFIGLADEYQDMKNAIPNLKHVVVSDALQLAKTIAGCKFFIGNQSFPFAVAEALKVKRVLEVCYQTPNVIVEGANGYDFCFQQQFEQIINDLMKNNN
jgi:hypothetical protein